MNAPKGLKKVAVWGVVSLVGAVLFSALGVPVAWLLGPMLASMALRSAVEPPARARLAGAVAGQWIVGSIMGAMFSLTALQAGLAHLLPLLALIAFTAALCLCNGWLLQRWAGVDYAAAFLGTLPGAASAVVAMSAELDVDRLMVTVLMYVRVLMVVLLAPLALSLAFPGPVSADAARTAGAEVSPPLALVALTALLAGAGALAGRRLRLPSPNFLGPFLLVMGVKIAFPQARLGLPEPLFPLGLLLLGSSIGMQFDLARLRHYWRPALMQAVLVAGLLAACMAAGYGFHRLTGVDMVTAILGTTPGGKETMIALSLAMDAGAELVMAMQTVRWLVILLLGPPLAVWAAKRRTTAGKATPDADQGLESQRASLESVQQRTQRGD